mmetsp:Transcript_149662/g.480540  ORF Transcript_149662/g.480540 Transcript_149662/m.480540 type:complete len:219 (+) Transcript_149662:355-1011(+)
MSRPRRRLWRLCRRRRCSRPPPRPPPRAAPMPAATPASTCWTRHFPTPPAAVAPSRASLPHTRRCCQPLQCRCRSHVCRPSPSPKGQVRLSGRRRKGASARNVEHHRPAAAMGPAPRGARSDARPGEPKPRALQTATDSVASATSDASVSASRAACSRPRRASSRPRPIRRCSPAPQRAWPNRSPSRSPKPRPCCRTRPNAATSSARAGRRPKEQARK